MLGYMCHSDHLAAIFRSDSVCGICGFALSLPDIWNLHTMSIFVGRSDKTCVKSPIPLMSLTCPSNDDFSPATSVSWTDSFAISAIIGQKRKEMSVKLFPTILYGHSGHLQVIKYKKYQNIKPFVETGLFLYTDGLKKRNTWITVLIYFSKKVEQ